MSPTAEKLLMEFIHQKTLILERAGVERKAVISWSRAVALYEKQMEAMAEIVDAWNMSPEVVMQAAFEQSFRNRHPDGPQMTMLKSQKFLLNALSFHLNLPAAAIIERRGDSHMLQAMDDAFAEVEFPADLLSFTVEDVGFRYAEARRRGENHVASHLAPFVLERIQNDRKMGRWLEHKGYDYLEIAKHYHETITS